MDDWGNAWLLPSHLSDADLIAGCVDGQVSAWDALIDRYERLVYSIPVRSGLFADDASDMLQMAFTNPLRDLRRIRDPQGIAAWQSRTAKRDS